MSKYFTKYELRWAFIFTLFSIVWTVFEAEMGWHNSPYISQKYLSALFLIPAALIFFLFFEDKKSKRFRRRFKFKHAFFSGMALTFYICLLGIPSQFLIHSIILPNYIEEIYQSFLNMNIIPLQSIPNIFNIYTFAFIISPLFHLLIGFIYSVLWGLILKGSRHRR